MRNDYASRLGPWRTAAAGRKVVGFSIAQPARNRVVVDLESQKVSATMLNMLKVLTGHGRLGMVRPVVQAAYKLWEQRSGMVHVELEVPQPAAPSLQQEILASLKQVLGAEPQVTTRINPDLIAGFVVRVGDRVFDASARTSLENSRQAMLERAVEAIQGRPQQFLGE